MLTEGHLLSERSHSQVDVPQVSAGTGAQVCAGTAVCIAQVAVGMPQFVEVYVEQEHYFVYFEAVGLDIAVEGRIVADFAVHIQGAAD